MSDLDRLQLNSYIFYLSITSKSMTNFVNVHVLVHDLLSAPTNSLSFIFIVTKNKNKNKGAFWFHDQTQHYPVNQHPFVHVYVHVHEHVHEKKKSKSKSKSKSKPLIQCVYFISIDHFQNHD